MACRSHSTTTGNVSFVEPSSRLAYDVHEFVRRGIEIDPPEHDATETRLWGRLSKLGTELWLDTDDFQRIQPQWNGSFSALTTNTTLATGSIRKGEYDALIGEAAKLLSGLEEDHRIREIAFIIGATHALKLVAQFGYRANVMLHADVVDDGDAICSYAHRYYDICPEYFVVKVPFTSSGLIAARQLRSRNIPVHITYGFSARQNYIATALANPSYVDVLVGRLNAYISDNHLGDGRFVGEKTTLASQHEVNVFSVGLPQSETRQVATDLRSIDQVRLLAGVDVMAMPPHIAQSGGDTIKEPWRSRLNDEYTVSLGPDVDADALRLDTLWHTSAEERKFVEQMILGPPKNADDLQAAARDHGIRDIFPQLDPADVQTVANQGEIPQHDRWGDQIMNRDLAIDSLMTITGLAHFTTMQQELDTHIRNCLA